ncbi:amidohydrolase family protein [Sphaerisporangium flaviroseum]|uniref:Amidohydrolase family protein n=1 Tax=Sphaerisporangium flaviroseum TaxID=509199 RepID=A0ABP7IBB6_9ACTN
MVDGRVASIAATGERADGALVVHGEGGSLLPGLVDAHVHMLQWAGARRRISLAGADSAVAAVDRLVTALEGMPGPARPDEFLFGAHFGDGLWPDRPHKDLLERALPGRPVALFSNDLHTCWLSPAALALIGRDHPSGVFTEKECMEITAALPSASAEVQDRWVLEAADDAAARGVTEVVDFEYADTVADWSRRLRLRTPSVRVSCVIARFALDGAIERRHRTGEVIPGSEGLLKVGPCKLFVDGSLNTRTAYCHDPYPGQGSSGELVSPLDELVPVMRRAARHGIHPALHAIGDRANTIALDAFAMVGCPGRIEHAQLVRHEDLPRFAELGVRAGVQPAHAPDDRDVAERYWPGRTGRAYAYAAMLAAGVRLEFGSDAPVSPLDPWNGIASAVARTGDDRPAWHAEQAIPLDAAMAAASGGRTRVRVGDQADLVVTGCDPRELPARELPGIPIRATLLAGRPTFLAG